MNNMFFNKLKKVRQNAKGNRILITVNILGSSGPIRFIVYERELVSNVIDIALKSYAREGRLPIIGSNLNDFVLYCPTSAGSDNPMSMSETIGARGGRNFALCKKSPPADEAGVSTTAKGGGSTPGPTKAKKRGASFKAWLNKSLSFKI